jgi:HD-GYP domain-containing protein (c-di-GMP phosphodiesterase class II)
MVASTSSTTVPFVLANVRPAAGFPAGVQERLERLTEMLGWSMGCVDGRTGQVIAQSSAHWLPFVPAELVCRFFDQRCPEVVLCDGNLLAFSIPLTPLSVAPIFACGYVRVDTMGHPSELAVAARKRGWQEQKVREYIDAIPVCPEPVLRRLIALAERQSFPGQPETVSQKHFDALAAELDAVHGEVHLLHTLTQSMHVSRTPGELVDLTLSRMSAVIPAAAHLIWLDLGEGDPLFQCVGAPLLDAHRLARLVARFDDHSWQRPLVKSKVSETLLGADFPGLDNFCLVPIMETTRRYGWLLTANLEAESGFNALQTSVLSSIATLLGTHSRNVNLYSEHDDLLLSFVRSLVSSLDAKDQYTRGHSERVALIAQQIGREMNLPEDDLRDIYLSGLLHDIGKIGVNDEIIRKPGNLTPEEFEQVKKHPVIGYNILAGLKNLKRVLPGVRNHHEAFNGTGYPDAIAGDAIPMMARIMAVADSYDAMGSDRPYRKGMPLEKLETVLHGGSGNQWDPRVVAAYFACREKIIEICQSYNLNNGTVLIPEENRHDSHQFGNDLTTASLRAALYSIAAG